MFSKNLQRRMHSLFTLVIVAFLAGTSMGCAAKVIKAGEVGIQVNQWGSHRGVEDYPLITGRVIYNPFTTDVFEFPTFRQNHVWTKDKNEGSPNDESITFNSVEGAVVNADVFISYSFVANKVPSIYVEFRQPAETITNVYIRSEVRDAFSRYSSTMMVADIFGAGKAELERRVLSDLQERLGPKGFKIDAITFVGALRVDKNVSESIHAVIIAKQNAIQAQNKIVQSTAEARQNVERARGDSLSAVIRAMGQAKANDELARSLTPQVLEWTKLNKWNGVNSQVVTGTGTGTLINVK